MTVANPDAGSFRTFAAKVFGQGAGFVVGWVYWTGMVLAMSSEATAVSILTREWIPKASIPLIGSLIRFRKLNGCPPEGKCQMRGYPYTSWIVFCLPIQYPSALELLPSGTVAYSLIYLIIKFNSSIKYKITNKSLNHKLFKTGFSTELSDELSKEVDDKKK